jgi:dTDP-4-dehydrorhamnose reductase
VTVLVTGGSGQLGGAIKKMKPDWFYPARTELDLAGDDERIVQFVLEASPPAVIHCAAWTAVDDAELPHLFNSVEQINAVATGAIVTACRELGIPVYYISTDYVLPDEPWYGIPRSVREDPAPVSVYGLTKWHGEREVLRYDRGRVVRLAWLHGHSDKPNFIKTMLRLAASGKDPVPVVDDQFGRPTFAQDAAGILVFAAEGAIGLPPITHLQNSGDVVSWHQLAQFAVNHTARLPTRITRISGEDYRRGRLEKGLPCAPRPRNSVLIPDQHIKLPDWRPRTQLLVRELLESGEVELPR